ncbi:uncharacterized protein Bfra_005842 [Botrytis fragariae]|uniref:Uncharacterized protein n=1 Tax=Botrytis fragariae TaxID=1964551 RepID=A0A8H6ARZ0_9HELO|nr:uncharacterized protein Bfra_005842 [Botrytis fragariae]KAF5872481.1 hypothetical protein Bfra_005842 [Botrytis fragariae]
MNCERADHPEKTTRGSSNLLGASGSERILSYQVKIETFGACEAMNAQNPSVVLLAQPRLSLRATRLNRHQFPVLNIEIQLFADQDMLLIFVAKCHSSVQLDRIYIN